MRTFKESIAPFMQTDEMQKDFFRITGKTFEEADEKDIRRYTDYLEQLAGYTEKDNT